VGEHFDGFATEHKGGDSAPTVRRDHNQVASSARGNVNNGLIGMLVLGVHDVATYTGCRGSILDLCQALGCDLGHACRIGFKVIRNDACLGSKDVKTDDESLDLAQIIGVGSQCGQIFRWRDPPREKLILVNAPQIRRSNQTSCMLRQAMPSFTATT
jgi:hypothetical protein